MNFCEDCDDMLYVKIKLEQNDDTEEEESKLVYLCKTCQREYPQDNKMTNCVYNINYNICFVCNQISYSFSVSTIN